MGGCCGHREDGVVSPSRLGMPQEPSDEDGGLQARAAERLMGERWGKGNGIPTEVSAFSRALGSPRMLVMAWRGGWERSGVGLEQGRTVGVWIWRTKPETAPGGHWCSLSTTCVRGAFHLPAAQSSREAQRGGALVQGRGGWGGLGREPRACAAPGELTARLVVIDSEPEN